MVESKNKLLKFSTETWPYTGVTNSGFHVKTHFCHDLIWVSNQHNIPWTCPEGGWGDCLWIIPASAVGFSCFLTVQPASHNVHLDMGYSSCPKAAVQDTLCSFGNKTNRCEALCVAWKSIILLNAFNKVMASLCSDGLTLRCCLYVCTTLITSVVFVYFPLWIRFWQWCCIIAFYFMRGSWFNMMEKKNGPIPKSVAQEVEGTGAAGSRPQFHPRPVLRAFSLPVHADGTALPDFIWGNQIPPLLPLERRSISSHMSTRFVRLFITINCCST